MHIASRSSRFLKRVGWPTLLGASALALGFSAWSRRAGDTPVPREPRNESAQALTAAGAVEETEPVARVEKTSTALVASPAMAQATTESVALPLPPAVRAKISAVFPEITGPVADWRRFRPEKLTVVPGMDLEFQFSRESIKEEGRYVTWIGRIPSLPGASLVGVATEAGYDAIVVLPGASQFSLHVRGDDVVIAEAAPGEESCGVYPTQAARPAEKSGDIVTEVIHASVVAPPPPPETVISVLKVDVLVAYDADTLATATSRSGDPVGYIDGQAKAMVETSNVALRQSLVTAFEWRFLGVVAAPAYPRTGKLVDDHDAMKPGGAIGEWVSKTRYQRGADQIMLFVGGANDWGGIASSPKQTAVSPSFAISVMKWTQSYKTFAHELAHNFGCKHDRGHYEVDVNIGPDATPVAAPDGDGFWCYGQLWRDPAPSGSATTTGTIMSYGNWIIPYFSNPNLSVNVTGSMVGRSAGLNLGLHQIGRAETDPKAADNARVLTAQAAAMSAVAEQIVLPTISQQPLSATVLKDSSLSLRVGAEGGGLFYQWRKNGVNLEGATNASYVKTMTDGDAATYSVVVSNHAGSVTSTDAVIVLGTTPIVTPPTPAPAGGGGGGGGAPSAWFYGAVGALLALRWLRMRRGGLRAERAR